MKKNDQDTLIQLHNQNIERQKIIDNQKQKLDRILELVDILSSDVLSKYPKDGVEKKAITEFIDVIRITILGGINGIKR